MTVRYVPRLTGWRLEYQQKLDRTKNSVQLYEAKLRSVSTRPPKDIALSLLQFLDQMQDHFPPAVIRRYHREKYGQDAQYYTYFGVVLIVVDCEPRSFTTKADLGALAKSLPKNQPPVGRSFNFSIAAVGNDPRSARLRVSRRDCRLSS